MLNNAMLVGRIEEINNNIIIIKVNRNYKDVDGNYGYDMIPFRVISDSMKENITTYCNIGDSVGVKGRIENNDNNIIIVADKLSFLSNKKESE